MPRKAIDIVILPPKHVMDIAIQIATKAYERGEEPYVLNAKDRIPHITLLMGVTEDDQFPPVVEKLADVLKEIKQFPVNMTKQERHMLVADADEHIQSLHEAIVKEIDPMLSHDATEDCFQEEPGFNFDEKSTFWVNKYPENSAFEKFNPHITIKNKRVEDSKEFLPFTFTADTIAITHMGDAGTSREILATFKLQ